MQQEFVLSTHQNLMGIHGPRQEESSIVWRVELVTEDIDRRHSFDVVFCAEVRCQEATKLYKSVVTLRRKQKEKHSSLKVSPYGPRFCPSKRLMLLINPQVAHLFGELHLALLKPFITGSPSESMGCTVKQYSESETLGRDSRGSWWREGGTA